MKKIILIGSGILIIVILFLFFLPSDEVKNPLSEEKNIKLNNVEQHINISEKSENKNIKKFSKEFKNNKDKKLITISNNQNNDFKNGNKNYIIINEIPLKKLNNFIEKKHLRLISSIKNKNIQIYAVNPPQKNDFAPPMPPVFVRLQFKSSNDIIAINSNLINANKQIYIVKKDSNIAEVKEIDTKKIEDYMPPAIGQN